MNALNPPLTVGFLDPELLTDLGQQFPNLRTGADWYRDSERLSRKPALLDTLRPLTSLILEHRDGVEPWGIFYSVRTTTLQPVTSQVSPMWHVDGTGNSEAIVVADALPTEFLVKRRGLQGVATAIRQAKLRKRAELHRFEVDIDEQSATDAKLKVYTPKPYEMALMKRHIHRSPINPTDQPITRTWIRAIIHQTDPGIVRAQQYLDRA